MRLIAFVVALFLFFSTVEAGGFWLLGRWYISSRYASVSLATVKSWLDRGIIKKGTEWGKIFVNRYGKWIILTIGLSQVIKEVERLSEDGSLCYVPVQSGSLRAGFDSNHQFGVYDANNPIPTSYYTASVQGNRCVNIGYIPAYVLYKYDPQNRGWGNRGRVPSEGTFTIGRERDTGKPCQVTISLNIPRCPFDVSNPVPSFVNAPAPSIPNLDQEMRRVPVRVFPNPSDFLRDDVIQNDPALRWLRDEYQRIARDTAIPEIPAGLLGDLELPKVDWNIPDEEAIDQTATNSRTSVNEGSLEGEGSREGDRSREREADISVPGLDTNLPSVERRPFPVELINSLVQNHPLLRILQGVNFDAGSGGSCQVRSGVFEIDFCPYQWIFNLMGAIIVPIAFLVGLFGWRND